MPVLPGVTRGAMTGKYYEEFAVGQTYESVWKTVSESAFRRFVELAGLQEPLFESRAFLADETDYDGLLVPGYLTMSLALGLFTRSGWLDGTGLAMLGGEFSFDGPVVADDEIRTHVEVTDTTPTSSDRGGIIELEWETETDNGDLVFTMTSTHFIKKQP